MYTVLTCTYTFTTSEKNDSMQICIHVAKITAIVFKQNISSPRSSLMIVHVHV